jgi:hypothetical protein
VLEPGVHRAWIDQMSQRKLLDAAQPLKYGRINDLQLAPLKAHEPVHWVAKVT